MWKCAVCTFFLSVLPSEARLGCTQEEIGRGQLGVQSPSNPNSFFLFTHHLVATESLRQTMFWKCARVCFWCEEFDTALSTICHGLLFCFFFLFVHKEFKQSTKRIILQGFPGKIFQ